jgi:hypothetical protein
MYTFPMILCSQASIDPMKYPYTLLECVLEHHYKADL